MLGKPRKPSYCLRKLKKAHARGGNRKLGKLSRKPGEFGKLCSVLNTEIERDGCSVSPDRMDTGSDP